MNDNTTPEKTAHTEDETTELASLTDRITAHGAAGNGNSTGAIEYNRFSDGGK